MKSSQTQKPGKSRPVFASRTFVFVLGIIFLCINDIRAQTQPNYTALPPLTTAGYYYGDVYVPDGKSLTITAPNARFNSITVAPAAQLIVKNTTIKMRGKIIVQQFCYDPSFTIAGMPTGGEHDNCIGGELLVQSSTITVDYQAPRTKWGGIELWGPDNVQPWPTWQKAHAFFTNSIVSNAKTAVATYKSDNTHKGGVIRATSTKFLNNDLSIDYQGTPTSANTFYSPSSGVYLTEVPTNGFEYFLRCTFDYDANYTAPAAEGQYSNKHISLKENSKDIRILGCAFDDHYGTVRNCWGVSVFDADFVVDNKYDVTASIGGRSTQTAPSTFNNLYSGVAVTQFGGLKRTIVLNSVFTNTDHSIYAVDAFKPVFTNNTITIPTYNSYYSTRQPFGNGSFYVNHGIEMYACTNYTIEYNSIGTNSLNYFDTKTVGIYTSDGGSQANVIQLNSVSNCNFNYYAIGRNFQYAPQSGNSVGLRFLCNSNAGSKNNDFTVMGGGSTGPRGIAGVQASGSTGSAANTFAAKGAGGFYNFYMQNGCNPVKYYGTGTYNSPGYPSIRTSNVAAFTGTVRYCLAPFAYFPVPMYWEDRLYRLETDIAALNPKADPDSADMALFVDYNDEYAALRDSVLNHYMYGDTTVIHYDSLVYALENMNLDYDYKLWLAGAYQSMYRYNDAIDLLESINGKFNLSGADADRVNNLRDIYKVLKKLYDNGNDWNMLDEMEQYTVWNIYYIDNYLARGIAAAILNRYLDVLTQNPVPDPDADMATIAMVRPDIGGGNVLANNEINLYPVPAQKILTVNWQPIGNEKDAMLYIADVTGRILLKAALQPGYRNVDIAVLPSGIYLSTVKAANGRRISQQKLVKE